MVIRPFDKVSLFIIELINEAFFLTAIVIFYFIGTDEEWTDSRTSTVMAVLLMNTIIVVIVLLGKNIYHSDTYYSFWSIYLNQDDHKIPKKEVCYILINWYREREFDSIDSHRPINSRDEERKETREQIVTAKSKDTTENSKTRVKTIRMMKTKTFTERNEMHGISMQI